MIARDETKIGFGDRVLVSLDGLPGMDAPKRSVSQRHRETASLLS